MAMERSARSSLSETGAAGFVAADLVFFFFFFLDTFFSSAASVIGFEFG
jgi:hypothetical protein